MIRRVQEILRERWRHRTLGQLYLLSTGIGALLFGSALLWLPERLTTGPSMATLYSYMPRATWGVVFYGLALLALYGAWKPTEERFIGILAIQVAAQVLWAVGLTVPSIQAIGTNGIANVLAPLAWLQLALTAVVVILSLRRPVLPPPRRRRTDPTD